MIISLFETVRLSGSISPRNLYYSLKSIKENPILEQINMVHVQWKLGNSNTNIFKLPDFSKMNDGPDFFSL